MNNTKTTTYFICFGLILSALWYTEKTKTIPAYAKVFYQLALECRGDCAQSKQKDYLEKSIHHSLQSDDPLMNIELSDAHFRLGNMYEAQQNRYEALNSYIRAAEVYGDNYQAHFQAGRIFYEESDFKQAMKHFLRTFKPGTGFPSEANYYLGHLYDMNKDYNLAIDHFLNVLPDQRPEIGRRLAQLYHLVDQKYGPNAREQSIYVIIRNLREYQNYEFADLLERHLAEFED